MVLGKTLRTRKLLVRFSSVRFQLKPVLVPPVRFPPGVFSGTDVLEGFPGRCFFWTGTSKTEHRLNHAHRVDFDVYILLVKFLPQTDEIRPQLGLFYGSTGSVRVTGSPVPVPS